MNILKTYSNHGLIKFLFVLFLLIIVVFAVGLSSIRYVGAKNKSEEWCAPGAPRHAPHVFTGEVCPQVGSMGGVKLAIPTHYLMGPVTYKGVDVWNAKSYTNSPKHPTFENEFDNFAIKIRLNNFKPIETQKDWDDFDKKDHTIKIQPPENRWVNVSFDARNLRGSSLSDMNFKDTLSLWLKDEAKRGPFEKKPDIWGLEHYVSVQKPSTKNSQYEIFYDAKNKTTFIRCQNTLARYSPYELFTYCEIEFVMPEIKALVNVGTIYVKEDLARWREVNQGVRNVARLFIVH